MNGGATAKSLRAGVVTAGMRAHVATRGVQRQMSNFVTPQ